MNGFFLILPLFLIRYGLLALLNRDALKRAAFTPSMQGKGKIAYYLYQISTAALLIYPVFCPVKVDMLWFLIGLAIYMSGILLCVVSTVNFSTPSDSGINLNGLYRISRNPMYIAYFLYFLGCVFLTQSLVLLAILIVFQISSHWIIIAEEKWCKKEFGERYLSYIKSVRRYL